jgi:transcription elongation factor GreA
MADDQHISQAAFDRLTAEIQDLRTHGRIDLADRIEKAREHGDLKENAEYQAAKEEKAKMEARIAKIAGILEHAVIIPEGEGDGTVANGSIVTLRYEGDGEDETERYLIGSIEERHDDLNVVSPTSPLGEALLGAAVGDVVGYAAPNGELRVEVVAVE